MLARSSVLSQAVEGEGRLLRISSRRRAWIEGLMARRCVAHVNAEEVVSCLGKGVSFDFDSCSFSFLFGVDLR